MPAWTRYVPTRDATPPQSIGALLSRSQSGKMQARATQHIGRAWQERLATFRQNTDAGQAMLAQIDEFWNRGTAFDIVHPDYATPRGAGGGTPLVAGASQTGTNLNTDGWPATTTVLRRGDLFTIGGLIPVYSVTADVVSDGAGLATLPINPPIYAGGSPADNAALTITGVLFRVRLLERPHLPPSDTARLIDGLTLTFVEAP